MEALLSIFVRNVQALWQKNKNLMGDEQSKCVWITGAGKGIGRALAKLMAKQGWTVAASSRTKEDLLSLISECPPGKVIAFPLDVSDHEQTVLTIKAIENKIGKLDLVVLNAGTHAPISVQNFSVELVRKLMEVNFMGVVNSLSEIIPRFMKQKTGQIAVVASLAGYCGLPSASAYGASKAALINMCEALKPELAEHGVRLNLINPGFVETPLTDKNDFEMPFLISAEDAANRIVKGLMADKFEIAFPRRLVLPMKLLRLLPERLFFALTKRMLK
jgi:NAD(P)-dependent dehydrogenase (short-subunit alcohol dehydrogenase family)